MRRLLSLITLIAALAVAIAGCGADDRSASTSATSAAPAKHGGALTVLSSGDIDTLDPGAWYYQYTYMALWQPTQRALFGWKPTDAQPSPDLATGKPAVSADGKTVTVSLRPGIHYSPPLQDRTVTSADVKYAIERAFLPQVGNGYVNAYFGDVIGVDAYASGKADGISGLQTPDSSTLVIKMSRPVGVVANGQALALPVTIPVPKDYAQGYDKGDRSTYGQHQVFTGPYMIANDGKGKLTGYEPAKRLELVRNPSWSASTDFRPAYVDTITFLGGNDSKLASDKILSGKDMVSGDIAVPPAVLKSALSRNKDQVDLAPSGITRLITLNTTIKPLDDVNVRRAIAAVVDRNALRLTRGGEVIGTIATHYIPPGVPGHEEAGGSKGTGADFMANPDGDVELAKEYLRKAGFADGVYDGPPLLMVGDNEAPGSLTGEALQSQLAKIGVKVNYRQVSFNSMQSKFCLVPAAEVAICPSLSWGRDFLDAQSAIGPMFVSANITDSYNVNFAQVNDPAIDRAIDAAEVIEDPTARASAWAQIDKTVTDRAYMVPWLWENLTNIRSADVQATRNTFTASWDLTFTSLK